MRDAAAYKAGHIAGAVNVGSITSVLRDPVTENWLPAAQVEKVLGNAGIDLRNKEVIVYGTAGNPSAHFGLLTVRYFGGKSGKVYEGGLDNWKAAGMTVSTKPTKFAPVVIQLAPQQNVVVWTDEVVGKLSDVKAGKVQILDVRTASEFSGRSVSAIRGGHIPGAVNISMLENWSNPPTPEMMATLECDVPGGFRLKPMADLKKLYASLDPNEETIVYCGSGVPRGGDRGGATRPWLQGRQGVQARLARVRRKAFFPRGGRGVHQHRGDETPNRQLAGPYRQT